ncbi:spermidine synthase [Streptomyces sp. SPB162]|nr:spermidine synthase [Streptomyces sp. SPB162]
MSARFEEIDWRPTPMGDISLRRRRDPVSGDEVYEVKLGDEFLMSSLFTAGEIALTRLGLAQLPDAADLDVVVGGLGLGYTAQAALDDPRVRSLVVVDTLGEVIDWHRRGPGPPGCRAGLRPPLPPGPG